MGTFLIYKSIYLHPRNWYDHYLYLAKAILEGRVDIPNLPEYYHDKIVIGSKIYLPFPPGASLILLLPLLFNKLATQQQISVIIGSLDVSLIFLLLSHFTKKKNALLLTLFFGFGTAFFWSSVVGTTWFFAHVVAIFFLILSLLSYFNKKFFLSGFLLALAALTRLPMIFAGFFYLLDLYKERKNLFKLILGASIFIPVYLTYNWLRFGNILTTGYVQVYQQYINSNYPYTIRQLANSTTKYFGYFDIKNIPLHLYTMFLLPPDFPLKPSPYGMGLLFTSPLLLTAFLPDFKDKLQRNLFISAILISIPTLLHYMQGWVQFGYRYMLDYIIFLMIILAIKFRANKKNLILLVLSLIVNFWGVIWAINLGW